MKMIANIPVVSPDWRDMPWVMAFTTVAKDGDTVFDFSSSARNGYRKILKRALPVDELFWLKMDHSAIVSKAPDRDRPPFDAVIITKKQTAAAITTADCLPIIITDKRTCCVALIHAGWRGIADGIIENCIEMLDFKSFYSVRAWIGPSVRDDYEIGPDVKEKILAGGNVSEQAFTPGNGDKYFADLCFIAQSKMKFCGILEENIEVYPGSTIGDKRFFSVRREGAGAGRMATVAAIV